MARRQARFPLLAAAAAAVAGSDPAVDGASGGGDCAGEYFSTFHALQTFSGHPLRPHFLGDADGCRLRGFRYFTVAAEYTHDGAQWHPEVFFGLCAPSVCEEGHVEVSLAPFYLQLLFSTQGVNPQFSDLRVQAAELGPLRLPPARWALLSVALLGVVGAATAMDHRRVNDDAHWIVRSLSVWRHAAALWTPGPDRLPSVSFARSVATIAVVAYHVFFLKRGLRSVAGMPLLARRVQHVCLLNTSVFSAMSSWLLYRSFRDARARCGRRPAAWAAWAAARLARKAVRQVPALLAAFCVYHIILHGFPQELHARQTYQAKRELCADFRQLVSPECWNTFANWGVLRDLQLDAALAALLACWGILGDTLGAGGATALLAVLVRALLRDELRHENLLWSFWYRRLPEALLALLAAATLAPFAAALRSRPWTVLLTAVAFAALTAEADWRSSQGVEEAMIAGVRQDPPIAARCICAVGFLPLSVAVLLALALEDAPWLRCCARHWFLGPLGDRLSLSILLGHNVIFQLVEGWIIVGPNWDYPFSWALWMSGLAAVLFVSWVFAAMAHLLFLGPAVELVQPVVAWGA